MSLTVDDWLRILPSACSAIASIASAVTAVAAWRITRRNAIDSVRPNLVPIGWSYEVINGTEVGADDVEQPCREARFSIERIRNVGRGPAMRVRAFLDYTEGRVRRQHGGPPIAVLDSNNESKIVCGSSRKNPALGPGERAHLVPAHLVIRCFDQHEREYEFRYVLKLPFPLDEDHNWHMAGAETIARNIMLLSLKVSVVSTTQLRAKALLDWFRAQVEGNGDLS